MEENSLAVGLSARVIYRYPLSHDLGDGASEIEMPLDSKIIEVNLATDGPSLWAIVDPTRPPVTRRFRWTKTGETIPTTAVHVKTVGFVGITSQGPGVVICHLVELL